MTAAVGGRRRCWQVGWRERVAVCRRTESRRSNGQWRCYVVEGFNWTGRGMSDGRQ